MVQESQDEMEKAEMGFWMFVCVRNLEARVGSGEGRARGREMVTTKDFVRHSTHIYARARIQT